MQIIDVHTHVFPPEIIAQRAQIALEEPWFAELYGSPQAKMATAKQLLDSMHQAGITHSVTFGFPFLDTRLRRTCNQYVLTSAARSDGRILPFALISPAERAVTDNMEKLVDAGALGFGELMPHGQGFSLDDSSLDKVVDKAQQLDRPIMIHTNEPLGHSYPGKSGPGPVEALNLSQRHPQARLVFSHWGGGLVFYETMPEVHAALQHTFYDSAALLYLYNNRAFSMGAGLAPKRILFGTDYPLIGQKRFIQHVQNAGLDQPVLQAFLYDNAAQLLGMANKKDGQ